MLGIQPQPFHMPVQCAGLGVPGSPFTVSIQLGAIYFCHLLLDTAVGHADQILTSGRVISIQMRKRRLSEDML